MFRSVFSLGEHDRQDDTAVSFDEWLSLACRSPVAQTWPALYPIHELLDFLKSDFQQLGVGEIVLDSRCACKVSPTLAQAAPVGPELIGAVVKYWQSVGGLQK